VQNKNATFFIVSWVWSTQSTGRLFFEPWQSRKNNKKDRCRR